MKVNFFIVGAPKAGTTSLYYYLNQHPEIQMSSQKEPDYFSNESIQKKGLYYGENRIKSIEEYHSLFEYSDEKIYGEASVSYLFYDDVPFRIKSYNSDAKIIIMLRNPIDRAFSHYLMDYKLGLINDSFEEVINKKSTNKNSHLFYQQYIELSEYSNQIKRYFDVFDINNILLIDYDDFNNNVEKIVNHTYQFLSVDNSFIANVNKKHNTFTMPKNKIIRFIYSFILVRKILFFISPKSLVHYIKSSLFKDYYKPELSEEIRQQLNHFFKADLKKLEQILDKDFSKWIK